MAIFGLEAKVLASPWIDLKAKILPRHRRLVVDNRLILGVGLEFPASASKPKLCRLAQAFRSVMCFEGTDRLTVRQVVTLVQSMRNERRGEGGIRGKSAE